MALQHDELAPTRTWRVQRVDVVLGVVGAGLGLAAAIAGGFGVVSAVAITACAAAGPALNRIDCAVRRLPNPITVPLIVLGAVCALWQGMLGNWLGPAIAAGAALLLFVMSLAGGIGMGDVKLTAALALAVAQFAWMPVLVIVAAFVTAGLVGIVALMRGVRRLPFGPFLVVGFAVALGLQVVR